jgi:hypothetical protein
MRDVYRVKRAAEKHLHRGQGPAPSVAGQTSRSPSACG